MKIYYILHPSYSKFYLAPDRKTVDRRYRYQELDSTGAPLFFYSGFRDQDAQTGDRRQVTDVMSDDPGYLVTMYKTTRLVKLHNHGSRSKYVVKPENVIECGNHNIWLYKSGKRQEENYR